MEGDEITAVLSRASELRSKINTCIAKTKGGDDDDDDEHRQLGVSLRDDEYDCLMSVRDALESLEEQLSSLQALQQQQKYEREATLAEIDHSRKILLEKIKEYKGEDLEVIHEASAFASETVEYNDDLLLPPYPSHPPRSLILDKGYPSSFSPRHKFSRNGLLHIKSITEARKNTNESEQEPTQPPSTSNSPLSLRNVIQVAAKTVLTLVSVASILSLAGFEPRLQRSSRPFKFLHLFQKPAANVKGTIQCPPGKILVMENGEPRCLVKERVQIPFEPVVTMPDINYGCG
ncbi:hypothetical protein Scep_000821 [Stephania cephalantha]|uniref:Plastid division protein PDV2 n=1 Tax=Stephania cephalantha TaxID=152367 RepID=A0AAP0L9J0_9MAGN